MKSAKLGFTKDYKLKFVQTDQRRPAKSPEDDRVVCVKMAVEGWKNTGLISYGDKGYVRTFIKPENDAEKLQMFLEEHDWDYEMSDSLAVQEDGSRHWAKIEALIEKMGAEGQAVFNQFIGARVS